MKKEVTDVMLAVAARSGAPLPRHYREAIQLDDDLWIGPRADRSAIIEAVQQRGLNTPLPIRQYASQYAFWRTNAQVDVASLRRFDPDYRLGTCVQLARVIRPTSVAYQFAARVVREMGRRRQIIPSGVLGSAAQAFVVDEDANWFRDEDAAALSELLHQFQPERLPARVRKALFYHEHVTRTPLIDIRWPLCITALEVLVHTEEPRSGRMGSTVQFVTRLFRLTQFVSSLGWTARDLETIYALRSGLVHGIGQGADALRPEARRLYMLAEYGLRRIIRSAIARREIAEIFQTATTVRTFLGTE